MNIISIRNGTPLEMVWSDEFVGALGALGDLSLHEMGMLMTDDEALALLREHEIAIVGWDARPLPMALAEDPGKLRYVCCYSGTIRGFVPREIVAVGMPVSNWGDLPADEVASGAMALLLAMAHGLPSAHRSQREGAWGYDRSRATLLNGLRVGIYGCGVIGHRFIEMLTPFRAEIRVHDPYVDTLPDGVDRADSLDELCGWSEALVIHAGWSEETHHAVGADQLAGLRDGAIVVNTARGGIIDQDALFAELVSGRLRAGIDTLEPEVLDPDDPIRPLDNALVTFHEITHDNWPKRPGLDIRQARAVEQVGRFVAGEQPKWLFDLDRYDRST